VAGERDLRLSSAELFVDRTQTELASSRGVEAGKTETSLFFDLVLLSGAGEREAESHGAYRVRRVADLDVEAIVARHARFARDGARAESMPEHTGPIVLTEGSFLPLFGPFRSRTSATSVYRKSSQAAIGDVLLGDRPIRGDRLTLVNDPTVPFATGSTPFDGDGLALGPVTVVENGTIRALAANTRYAGYLEIPATGGWSNTTVPAGTTGAEELLAPTDGEVLEIVEFSWLNPDSVRGRFSTEVRLAYLHGRDGSRVVKGGAFAGNVYELFANARFARETALAEEYHGPVAVRFDGARVVGA
jgi:PmbA protein